MAKKDYYLILGIPREATDRHVQRAFRRLAKEHHPDRTGPESTARFQQIAEAYEVLSDPAKRRAYDDRLGRRIAVRRAAPGPNPRPAPPRPNVRRPRVEPLVPEPLFSEPLFSEPLFSEPRRFRRGSAEDLSARDRESILDLYRILLRL